MVWRSLGATPFLGATLLLGACTATLIPPGEVEDPRRAFLLDHGRHTTLVLPRAEGGLVRYAYGDWDYYARNRTGLWQGTRAVLWPTRAGLGRRELAGSATEAGVRRAVAVGIREVIPVSVEADRVAVLRRELDALFRDHGERRHENRRYDLVFVPHPDSYSLASNSNGRVARWLESLGVQVSGWPLWSRWRRLSPEDRERIAPERSIRRAPQRNSLPGRGGLVFGPEAVQIAGPSDRPVVALSDAGQVALGLAHASRHQVGEH